MPTQENFPTARAEGIQAIATRERRAKILDAAVEAFTSRGYDGTSLRDVASRAGMSHTGLLHHYPDKIALLEAVLDDRLADASAAFDLDSHDGATFLTALVKIAEQDVADPTTIALFTKLSAESLTATHPAHDYFARWYETIRSRLTEAFEDLQRRGLYIGSVPPRTAALHAAALRDGLNLQWLLAPDAIDLPGAIRSHYLLYVDLEF